MKELEKYDFEGNKVKYYKFEKDDLFYVSAATFHSWWLPKAHIVGTAPLYGIYDFDVNEDMIFAVKYLGDGIIEETLTGEKLWINGFSLIDDGYKAYDVDLPNNKLSFRLDRTNFNAESDIAELNNVKKIITNFPLTINCYDWGTLSFMNDIGKEKYSKFSDEERIKFISNAKLIVQDTINEINKEIDKIVSINQAYLEHKGKTK